MSNRMDVQDLKKMRTRLAVAIAACAAPVIVGCSNGAADTEGLDFPIEVTTERVTDGKTTYEHSCATCHGQPGVSFPSLASAPPHDETGHTWHHPDRLLFEWIQDKPPGATIMPAFREFLTEEQIINVLAYIKSTWPEEIQQIQEEGSEQYEQQIRETN